MLLGTLGASLLGNVLAAKGIHRAGEEIVRASYGNKKVRKTTTKNKMEFLVLPHPLTNFEIQKYYHNQPRFDGVYSRDNLPKIDEAYVINLDEYSDIGTRCIALNVLSNYVTYFESFGVEHTPKEIKAFIGN